VSSNQDWIIIARSDRVNQFCEIRGETTRADRPLTGRHTSDTPRHVPSKITGN